MKHYNDRFFSFDFPINDGNKFLGLLNVDCEYRSGEVWILRILWTNHPNEIPKADVTGLIDKWADYLMEQLQEAAEHQAYDLGHKVHRLDDPRETELSEILKP